MTQLADPTDGRRLRRQHNREAAIAALVGLFAEGVYQPSAAEVAEHAGLSPRSLFRYFDDVDDLHRAAIDHQLALARPFLDVAARPDDPLDLRIRALVAGRARLYDAIAPGARAARITAHRHAVVARQVRDSRRYLRDQLRELFATELPAHDDDRLAAVDALCSFETYELMRHDQRLSRARVADALAGALSALLTSGVSAPSRVSSARRG